MPETSQARPPDLVPRSRRNRAVHLQAAALPGLAVRLEAVGKRYGMRRPWIVRNVSQEVAAGQLIKLEGRNGSGKSTLLRVIAGVSVPSAGRVTGRPRAGYVPERF